MDLSWNSSQWVDVNPPGEASGNSDNDELPQVDGPADRTGASLQSASLNRSFRWKCSQPMEARLYKLRSFFFSISGRKRQSSGRSRTSSSSSTRSQLKLGDSPSRSVRRRSGPNSHSAGKATKKSSKPSDTVPKRNWTEIGRDMLPSVALRNVAEDLDTAKSAVKSGHTSKSVHRPITRGALGKSSPQEASEANQAICDMKQNQSDSVSKKDKKVDRGSDSASQKQNSPVRRKKDKGHKEEPHRVRHTRAVTSESEQESTTAWQRKQMVAQCNKSDHDVSPSRRKPVRKKAAEPDDAFNSEDDFSEDVFNGLDYIQSKLSLGPENRRRRMEERARKEAEARESQSTVSPEPPPGDSKQFKEPLAAGRRRRRKQQPRRYVDDSRGETTSSEDDVMTSDSDRPRMAIVPPRRHSTDSSSDEERPMLVGPTVNKFNVWGTSTRKKCLSPRSQAVIEQDVPFNAALERLQRMKRTPPYGSPGRSPGRAESPISSRGSARRTSVEFPDAEVSDVELIVETEKRPAEQADKKDVYDFVDSEEELLQKISIKESSNTVEKSKTVSSAAQRRNVPKFSKSRTQSTESESSQKADAQKNTTSSGVIKVRPKGPEMTPVSELTFVENLCSSESEEEGEVEVIVSPAPLPVTPVRVSSRPSSPAQAKPRLPIPRKTPTVPSPRRRSSFEIEKPPPIEKPNNIGRVLSQKQPEETERGNKSIDTELPAPQGTQDTSGALESVPKKAEGESTATGGYNAEESSREALPGLKSAEPETVPPDKPADEETGADVTDRPDQAELPTAAGATEEPKIITQNNTAEFAPEETCHSDTVSPPLRSLFRDEGNGRIEVNCGPLAEAERKTPVSHEEEASSTHAMPVLSIAEKVKVGRSRSKQTARKSISPSPKVIPSLTPLKEPPKLQETEKADKGTSQLRFKAFEPDKIAAVTVKMKELIKSVKMNDVIKNTLTSLKASENSSQKKTPQQLDFGFASETSKTENNENLSSNLAVVQNDMDALAIDHTGCDDIDLSSIQTFDTGKASRNKTKDTEVPSASRAASKAEVPDASKGDPGPGKKKKEERVITVYVPLKQAAASGKQEKIKNSKCWPSASRRMRREVIEASSSSSESDEDYPLAVQKTQAKTKAASTNRSRRKSNGVAPTSKKTSGRLKDSAAETNQSRHENTPDKEAETLKADSKRSKAKSSDEKMRATADEEPTPKEKSSSKTSRSEEKETEKLESSAVGSQRTLRREIHAPTKYKESGMPNLGSVRVKSPEPPKMEQDSPLEDQPTSTERDDPQEAQLSPEETREQENASPKGSMTLAEKKRRLADRMQKKAEAIQHQAPAQDDKSVAAASQQEYRISSEKKTHPLKKRLVQHEDNEAPTVSESERAETSASEATKDDTDKAEEPPIAAIEERDQVENSIVAGDEVTEKETEKVLTDQIQGRQKKESRRKSSSARRASEANENKMALLSEGESPVVSAETDITSGESASPVYHSVFNPEEVVWFSTSSTVHYFNGASTEQERKDETNGGDWHRENKVKVLKSDCSNNSLEKVGNEHLSLEKCFTDSNEYRRNIKEKPFESMLDIPAKKPEGKPVSDRDSSFVESTESDEKVVLHEIEITNTSKVLKIWKTKPKPKLKRKTSLDCSQSLASELASHKEDVSESLSADVPSDDPNDSVRSSAVEPRIDELGNKNTSEFATQQDEEHVIAVRSEEHGEKVNSPEAVSQHTDEGPQEVEETEETPEEETPPAPVESEVQVESVEQKVVTSEKNRDVKEESPSAEPVAEVAAVEKLQLARDSPKDANADDTTADKSGVDTAAAELGTVRSSRIPSSHSSQHGSRRSSLDAQDNKSADVSEVDFSILDNPLDTDTEPALQVP